MTMEASCVRIDGRLVGRGQPTLIIAEIGVNHDGSVDRALELVKHAAAAGADAVKLQIFRADALMNAASSFAEYQKQHVSESSPIEMLRRFELVPADIERIVHEISAVGLIPIATPFSPGDVELIEQLKLPAIKIASPDLVNRVLLARAVAAGKPLIVSTGAATIGEIEETVGWFEQWRTAFVLMHCVSSYPTPADQAHLGWIHELSKFGMPVGYSDHTTDSLSGALSVAAGACVVEKHLTYDRAAAGPDHAASADPAQFAEYVRLIRAAEVLCGSSGKHVLPIERDVRNVSRQSLVMARTLRSGAVIAAEDLIVQRPGTGIPPADADRVIGRATREPLEQGTVLQWTMLDEAA